MFTHEISRRAEQLIDAACRVIARTGVRGLRMEALAREAGVSVGLPYRYFAGRDELLAAVLAYLASGAEPYQRRSTRELVDPQAALEELLTAELSDDPAARRTGRVWSELIAESVFDPVLRARLHDVTTHWIENVATALGHCVRRPPAEVRHVATALVATADGIHGWWVLDIVDTPRAKAMVLDALQESIRRATATGRARQQRGGGT